jgi:hypothetical protein
MREIDRRTDMTPHNHVFPGLRVPGGVTDATNRTNPPLRKDADSRGSVMECGSPCRYQSQAGLPTK